MIGRLLNRFCTGLRILLGVLMGLLAIPVAMQVISRYTGLIPTYLWTEELATFIFVWIVMIGSVVAVWDGTHFDVRVIPDAQRPLPRLLQNGVVHIAILSFGLMFAIYGIEYAEFGSKQRSVMMRANLLITHVSLPIIGSIWTVLAGYRLIEAIAEYRRADGHIAGDAQ
ncbi:TRAP transporter small permease subunit [Tateyamaria omphalii]|uniref:TRAP transporter small permease n=1 Tax=Tateyamaria omphalii TaxID=299262 RepID=UPI001C999169|nr:TRAP transporter small permease subunit [Tateyamaria omphalii]MBY5933758.1 TRAP transporter small permease subunit [Tateyamaria omphalii]